MIEVYVIGTLLGLGYVINKHKNEQIVTSTNKSLDKKLLPPGSSVHESNRYNVSKKIEERAAHASYAKSLGDLSQTRVLNRAHDAFYKSQLAGVNIPQKEFVHNNMVPFYRGSLKQNIKDDGNKSLLESFGTLYNTDVLRQKKEVSPLFDVTRDLTNPTGMKVETDFLQSRFQAPKTQNNTLPFEQVRVGPGLNMGYNDKPCGGFQQFDTQNLIKPKTVDELRVASKPKETFEGRTVDGLKTALPGKAGAVNKNRVETFYENNPDRYIKTTGAVLKDTMHPEYKAKYTARQDTSVAYQGVAFNNKATTSRAKVRDPHKTQLEAFDVQNPSLSSTGLGDKHDYGKANILVYANERDITTTKTHQGNVTTIVKAIVAPLQDIIKPNKKEFAVENPRHYGQMAIQIPSKQPVRDPNDVMRTTIKETMVQDSEMLNVRGPTKVTVYDPNDVARATMKETLVEHDVVMNLKGGAFKSRVHDPNDIARTTLKETTLHDSDTLNVRSGVFRGKAYDPNDIARTTIKETMLHDAEYTNISTGERRGVVYDPNVKAKTTVRNTLGQMETTLNMDSRVRKGTVHDPNDVAKTTIKETYIDSVRDGNINSLQGQRTSYQDESYDMKITQKETYVDNDYYGAPKTGTGDGYQIANVEAKTTQKEFISDNEYYGGLADQTQHKQRSYEDMYNACIDDLKESTLTRREPTQTSVKVVSGSESVNLDVKKIQCDEITERAAQNQNRIINQLQPLEDSTITRLKQEYGSDDRLDVDILNAFKENPYTKPLNSFA